VGEEAQVEKPFTVRELGAVQQLAYTRVLTQFQELLAKFS
jgi:hypothetical protein